MVYLIFILIPIALLAGFFALTGYEARNGTRLFSSQRVRLDDGIDRVMFVLTHVDFASFISELVRHFVERVIHDSVHISLLAVRAVERLLTRAVRHIRTERAINIPPRETAREFVQTLSDFKIQLKETPPKIPDIY